VPLTPSHAADDATSTIPLNGAAVARTPPPSDSQPNNGDVIYIDGRRKSRLSGVGQRARNRYAGDIDASTHSHEPVPASSQWWNHALAAFKAYIELSAVDTDASEAEDDGAKEI
jgi:hypothetical protein